MNKIPVNLSDNRVYGIYEKETDTLYISMNSKAKKGVIYIK